MVFKRDDAFPYFPSMCSALFTPQLNGLSAQLSLADDDDDDDVGNEKERERELRLAILLTNTHLNDDNVVTRVCRRRKYLG